MALSRSLITSSKFIKVQLEEFYRIKHVPHKLVITSRSSIGVQIRFLSLQKQPNFKLFEELTGCSRGVYALTVYKFPYLAELEVQTIYNVFILLKELGFKPEDLVSCLQIFRTHTLTLKNHYKLYEEVGANPKKITPQLLYKYNTIVKRKIRDLKKDGFIEDVDVTKKLALHSGMPDSACLPSVSENTSLSEAQLTVLKAFLNWRLDMTVEEVEQALKVYVRLKAKSFRLMREALNILEYEIGFTKEKIRSNAFLIHTDPDNIRKILKVKSLGGLSPSTAVCSNPKILTIPVDSIIKINALLEEFNIPIKHAGIVLNIYTLSINSVRERLNMLQSVPQFSTLCEHPSILRIVLYHKKASTRLKLLQNLKIKNVSLNIFSTNESKFERFTRDGAIRSRGDDIVFYLSKQLSVEGKAVRNKLKKHPYWYNVSVVNVKDTLQYMCSKNFTLEEIIENMQILLYSKSLVDQELTKLESQTNVESCRTSEGNLRRETLLPLTIYYMEQPYNFSGAGVWTSQSMPVQ